MQVVHASHQREGLVDTTVANALDEVSESYLRETVVRLSIPRHFAAQTESNRRVAHMIAEQLQSYGYLTAFQGTYANVVALQHGANDSPLTLVGAHYDSVPETPGADDNASAVAALLECARVLANYEPPVSVCFAAFNREEDGLLGSTEFVKDYLPQSGLPVRQAHILEMVGYCSHQAGTQHLPPGLPIKLSSVGDFLGLIGNTASNEIVDGVLHQAATYLPKFPVTGLKVHLGLEKYFPPLERSDHVPFWRAGIPAVMWTDTSEFRNPHYHQATDTPDTLDYNFLKKVTQLLVSQVLSVS